MDKQTEKEKSGTPQKEITMADKKASKKVVDDKPAAKAEEDFTIVTISGEKYKKYADRLENMGA